MSNITNTIEKINWHEYETAYGEARPVPDYLKALAHGDEKKQLKASHNLWSSLCHQHAYVSSAAEPSFPILLEIFPKVSELVQIELMDIFMGFAVCTQPEHPESLGLFQKRLRRLLINNLGFFKNLSLHSNEEIASFSEVVLENLQ